MARLAPVVIACVALFSTPLLRTARADGPPNPPPSTQPAGVNQTNNPAMIVLHAIQANPWTAPYAIHTSLSKGTVVLSGRVGTTQIHDIAVRTAIDLGYPFRDDLIIDTAEAHRVALAQSQVGAWGASGPGAVVGSAPYLRLSAASFWQG